MRVRVSFRVLLVYLEDRVLQIEVLGCRVNTYEFCWL